MNSFHKGEIACTMTEKNRVWGDFFTIWLRYLLLFFFLFCCRCFDRFFKAVNLREGKLVLRSRNSLVDRVKTRNYLMDDVDLIGLDYLWNAVLCSSEDIAQKAIELLRETFTSLGPRLVSSQVLIHEDFLSSCISRLRVRLFVSLIYKLFFTFHE